MSGSSKGLIVITGASSGIGEACARAFSGAGHPLLLLARRVERMEALGLPNCMCRKLDVTDGAAFNAAVAEAEAAHGPAECLINNAGVMLLGQIQDQDPAEWATMLSVNVTGVLNGMRAVLGGMLERKRGTIVNVSSIAGVKAFPNHAAYCATKFAVHGLTETVRQECASAGVRCVIVAPGVVETELLGHTTSDKIKDDYRSWKTTMGKALEAVDIANVVLFAFQQPQHVCLREIVIGPTQQEP